MKDDTPPLEDLLKPLSAKVGRVKYSAGGREQDDARTRMGDARRFVNLRNKRLIDAQRRKDGKLK